MNGFYKIIHYKNIYISLNKLLTFIFKPLL